MYFDQLSGIARQQSWSKDHLFVDSKTFFGDISSENKKKSEKSVFQALVFGWKIKEKHLKLTKKVENSQWKYFNQLLGARNIWEMLSSIQDMIAIQRNKNNFELKFCCSICSHKNLQLKFYSFDAC